jgi:hypothetical protein
MPVGIQLKFGCAKNDRLPENPLTGEALHLKEKLHPGATAGVEKF